MALYYKFRSCSERNFMSLENNQIYASPINFFNDPFEIVCWEDDKQSDSERNTNESLLAHLKTRTANRSFHCVSSFTSEEDFLCNGLLMWAHYADGHKGFCIAYNEHLLDGLKEGAINEGFCGVKYSDELPDIPTDGDNRAFLNVIRTKSKIWEYEQEVRMIYSDSGVKQLNNNVVDAIYMGCKISNYNKWILMGIAKRLGVKCYKIEFDPIKNKLKRVDVTLENISLE